jgi:hypothetical protein
MNQRLMPVTEAAHYCGLKSATFKQKVAVGVLPPPVLLREHPLQKPKQLWDKKVLDMRIDKLSGLDIVETDALEDLENGNGFGTS